VSVGHVVAEADERSSPGERRPARGARSRDDHEDERGEGAEPEEDAQQQAQVTLAWNARRRLLRPPLAAERRTRPGGAAVLVQPGAAPGAHEELLERIVVAERAASGAAGAQGERDLHGPSAPEDALRRDGFTENDYRAGLSNRRDEMSSDSSTPPGTPSQPQLMTSYFPRSTRQ
jgi:hypothetical protein